MSTEQKAPTSPDASYRGGHTGAIEGDLQDAPLKVARGRVQVVAGQVAETVGFEPAQGPSQRDPCRPEKSR